MNITGPLDISMLYMLKENKRIYAIIVCFIGGTKMAIEGILFDEYIKVFVDVPFYYERILIIIFNILGICLLYGMVKDEIQKCIAIKLQN
jgi:hypothetical protein